MEFQETQRSIFESYAWLAIITVISLGVVLIFSPLVIHLGGLFYDWVWATFFELFGIGFIVPDPLTFMIFIVTTFLFFTLLILPYFFVLIFVVGVLYIGYKVANTLKVRIARTKRQNTIGGIALMGGVALGGIIMTILLFLNFPPVFLGQGDFPNIYGWYFFLNLTLFWYFLIISLVGIGMGYGLQLFVDFIYFIYRRAYNIKLVRSPDEYEYFTTREFEAYKRIRGRFRVPPIAVYITLAGVIGAQVVFIFLFYIFLVIPYTQALPLI